VTCGKWAVFSGQFVSSTNKIDRHDNVDISEMLLKMELNPLLLTFKVSNVNTQYILHFLSVPFQAYVNVVKYTE
jgi:hypothetical protein